MELKVFYIFAFFTIVMHLASCESNISGLEPSVAYTQVKISNDLTLE
jgi:hypothetical protein